jgi:protein subunit release factor A
MSSAQPQKHLLFSITKKDFRIDTFRSGGKGGQNQNKRDTGVRIVHLASGAAVESREERSQLQNKRKAFLRLVDTSDFKNWYRIEVSRRLGNIRDLERDVDEMMKEENLKIEYFDPEEM